MTFHRSLFFCVKVKEKELRLQELRSSESRFELAHPMQAGTIPAGREFMHCDSRQKDGTVSCWPGCHCLLEKGLFYCLH